VAGDPFSLGVNQITGDMTDFHTHPLVKRHTEFFIMIYFKINTLGTKSNQCTDSQKKEQCALCCHKLPYT